MNKIIILGLGVFATVASSCESSTNAGSSVNEDSVKVEQTNLHDTSSTVKSDTLKITGVITKIENGKDGYMATLKDSTGREFVATISMVNLQRNGSGFKRYKEGEKITITGPSWKDDANLDHITVMELQ